MAYPPEQLAPRQTSKQPSKQALKPAAKPTAKPTVKPTVKPAAKLVGQKPVVKKPRHPVSQPVDPDDLRRRLYIVISQRDAASEKRRQARVDAAAKKAKEAEEKAAAAQQEDGETSRTLELKLISEEDKENEQRRLSTRLNGQNAPYVPQTAALQFARTATAQNMQNSSRVHELSRPALKVHTETLAFDKSVVKTSSAGQARAIRRVQSERQKLRERNQFQTSRILEGSADVELTQKAKKRYTIPSGDLPGGIMTSKRFSVRRSLDCDERDVMGFLKPIETSSDLSPLVNPSDHRMVDWSQSDEPQEKKRSPRSPLLRKADSLWGLKDRLGKYSHDKDTTVDVDLSEKVDANAVPKPVKRGFWTKVIKRHAATVQA